MKQIPSLGFHKQRLANLLCLLIGAVTATGFLNEESGVSETPRDKFEWNWKERKVWVERQNDPRTWNMDVFHEDLSFVTGESYKSLPIKPAITWMPTPHPEYSNWGGALSQVPLDIEDKAISSALFTWGNFRENRAMFEKPSHQRATYLNLHVLTDAENLKNKTNNYSSRNFPHVLVTGKYKTSVGDIDYVAMGLADGNSYAIIGQRIFDLNFGRTILVAPQKDGSVRFLQMDGAPKSFLKAQTHEVFRKYHHDLQADPKVIEFFCNDEAIGS